MSAKAPEPAVTTGETAPGQNALVARRLGVDTQHENVVFMRKDCHVCRSEGFSAHARVRLRSGDRSIIATLYQVTDDLLDEGEAGLSESAWHLLDLKEGDQVEASHPQPLESLSKVRGKIYGKTLDIAAFTEILNDVAAGRYSDIHISSFVSGCAARGFDLDEMIALTHAMVDVGDRLKWATAPIADKHCIGGLPGNRTTPIVVSILASCGATMPKTSSRAITSPAGTADTMETMAPVDLDLATLRRVVEREGGCIAWGGAVRLSPVDDLLIRVERALDIDSEGQLVASVISKKIAAGATHLVLDIPVGPTAKARSAQSANELSRSLCEVAEALGLNATVVLTDGLQPVGRGIGPALEAHDVLAVLRGETQSPSDLRDRAVSLAGALLESIGLAGRGRGVDLATLVLDDGRAWSKFQRICEAQGGMREPPQPSHSRPVFADRAGRVAEIDNRKIAKVAKLAGAPDAKAAGVSLEIRVDDLSDPQSPLFTVHAETKGELNYALAFVASNSEIVRLEDG